MKIGLVTSTSNLNLKDAHVFVKGLPPYLDFLVNKKSSSLSPPIPQLGVIAIASFLKDRDIDVDVFDFSLNNKTIKSKFKNYDIIGISSTSLHYGDLVKISKFCRALNPNTTIIAGGQVASFHAKELTNKKFVDGVVVGEGEMAFFNIAMKMKNHTEITKIQGLYTSKGYTKGNCLQNLDVLPLPQWDFLELDSYIPTLPIQTMRGCPYSCAYCKETRFWEKPVRFKSEKRVVEEIKHNVESYGIKTFRIVDSCFNAFPKRTKKICNRIQKENLDIKWTCYARADNLSNVLVESMAQAGCISVDIGAESGSNKILKAMCKHSSPQKIKNAIKICKHAGMLVHTNFIIGFPGETKKTIFDTVSLIKEAKPTTYCFNPLFVYPGTPLYEKKEKYGLVGRFDTWKHKTMNSKNVEKIIHQLYKNELSQLSGVYYFFGGEHAANIMKALGYNKDEIIEVYKSFNDLCYHKKKWAIKELVLSKLGLGNLQTFLKVARDLKAYAM